MFLGPWACGSECCSSNSNAPDISQKGLIGIQSHHSREKMSKKAREKPAEAGSASVSPYGSVLGYELVTSQPNGLINLIWPECRTWFIGPWFSSAVAQPGFRFGGAELWERTPPNPERAPKKPERPLQSKNGPLQSLSGSSKARAGPYKARAGPSKARAAPPRQE